MQNGVSKRKYQKRPDSIIKMIAVIGAAREIEDLYVTRYEPPASGIIDYQFRSMGRHVSQRNFVGAAS